MYLLVSWGGQKARGNAKENATSGHQNTLGLSCPVVTKFRVELDETNNSHRDTWNLY